jgi:hypothetical protein
LFFTRRIRPAGFLLWGHPVKASSGTIEGTHNAAASKMTVQWCLTPE